MIVDFEHHYLPAGLKKDPFPPGLSEVEEHLAAMDQAGIDVAVLSGHAPPFEECGLLNEDLARLQSRFPERLVGLAHTVPHGGPEAMAELERAVSGLGLRGVAITAQPGGKPLDDRQLWPFYQTVQKLDVPVYVHCSTKGFTGFDALGAPYRMDTLMGWEMELMSATGRLILGGVLEEFPGLKIVISHFGGGIASIMDRLTAAGAGPGSSGGFPSKMMKKPFRDYMGMLYFDMAGFLGGMGAVKCALTAIPPGQLVFGSDYPYNFYRKAGEIKKYIENIEALDLPPAEKKGMLGDTAARLLRLR